jgi:hypothetical protein
MVLNLGNLPEFIKQNSTIQQNHVIWNQCVLKHVTMAILAKEIGLSKKVYYPNELFWIIENQKEMDINTRLERTCQISNCISHYNVIQYNLESVVEMDVDSYIKVCERFDKFCEKDTQTTCINWNGSIVHGYGQFTFLGKNRRAHCVSYMLEHGEDIPKGQVVRHLCPTKNKRCVNPDHLTIGTYQDEIDGVFILLGEKHPNATISNELAQMIIDSFGNKQTVKDRATQFGVSKNIIKTIDAANAWRSLMTSEQIVERESAVRRRNNIEVLSDDIIQKVKSSKESIRKCAKTYNITKNIVQRIKN